MKSDRLDSEGLQEQVLLRYAGTSPPVSDSDENGGDEEGFREVASRATDSVDISPLSLALLSKDRRINGMRYFQRNVAQCTCHSIWAFDGAIDLALLIWSSDFCNVRDRARVSRPVYLAGPVCSSRGLHCVGAVGCEERVRWKAKAQVG